MKGEDMQKKNISECMEQGAITLTDREDSAGKIEWYRHPKFTGVFLKNLILGADTDGMLSCHMVKIDPGAVLENHVHEFQWELHEILEGDGMFLLGTREAPYYPGCMGVIPRGTEHRITAGRSGLVLLAKFFPPLM
jgi:mannose-6-phosphate isomerase-like protein (cupin superfamily)